MLYTLFDIETTGLSRSKDAVVQFAYTTITQDFVHVRSACLHFYKDGMPWSYEAEKVHGLSQDYLKQFKGQYHANLQHMYSVLQYGNLIGHNSKSFDIPFSDNFMCRNGLPTLEIGTCYDTMLLWRSRFGKAMRLQQLPAELGITQQQITAIADMRFKNTEGIRRPHDAPYDVTATYFVLRAAVNTGLCSLKHDHATLKIPDLSI